jgi:hypothetical protein
MGEENPSPITMRLSVKSEVLRMKVMLGHSWEALRPAKIPVAGRYEKNLLGTCQDVQFSVRNIPAKKISGHH